jgi:hypothetical protein
MSYVLSVIIQMDAYKDEEEKALESLNGWLKENDHLGGEFKFLNGNESAGTKHPEISVLWGGFNYLQTDEFIEFFKSLKLRDSLLTIKSPDEGPYVVVRSDEHTRVKLGEDV